MSAPQPVKQTFFFDNEPITPADLEILKLYSQKSAINLNSASEQMFRVPPEGLTRKQGNVLFGVLFEAAIKNHKPKHAHRCVECGNSITCSQPGCTETEGECRKCKDGIFLDGRYFWNGRWEPIL